MKYKHFKQKALGYLCRNCINSAYHLSLEPVDCKYIYYPQICLRCNEQRHIVKDISLKQKVQVLCIKEPKDIGVPPEAYQQDIE